MKILTLKDRIKLSIKKIEFTLKPLSQLERNSINSHKKSVSGATEDDILMSSFAYIKHAVVGIKGVKTYSGDEYELEFDGDYLTDDCASEIMCLNMGPEFYHLIQRLMYNEIPEKPTYAGTKKPLKGVKLEVMVDRK